MKAKFRESRKYVMSHSLLTFLLVLSTLLSDEQYLRTCMDFLSKQTRDCAFTILIFHSYNSFSVPILLGTTLYHILVANLLRDSKNERMVKENVSRCHFYQQSFQFLLTPFDTPFIVIIFFSQVCKDVKVQSFVSSLKSRNFVTRNFLVQFYPSVTISIYS